MLQTAKKLDAIAEGGSVVALTYIAAQRTFPGYADMADAKSLFESSLVALVITMEEKRVFVSILYLSRQR